MRLIATCLLLLTLPVSTIFKPAIAQSELHAAESISIGIFPRRDPLVTIRMFKPLRAYLEKHLGIPVKLETAPNFRNFESRLKKGQYDLVHFNQCHYIETHATLGYQVIVQNEEFGEKTIRGAIFARKDSGITSLQQLRGKTVLFGGGEKAMVSYLIPRYLLQREGIDGEDITQRFANSPPNALLALYQKQVSASGAGTVVARLPLVTGKIDISQLAVLAQSEPMSHLPWAVKPDMDPSLKDKIRQLLTGLKDSETGRTVLKAARLTGINPATDTDYDDHRAILKAMTGIGCGL